MYYKRLLINQYPYCTAVLCVHFRVSFYLIRNINVFITGSSQGISIPIIDIKGQSMQGNIQFSPPPNFG
jgi:hypothetical protein